MTQLGAIFLERDQLRRSPNNMLIICEQGWLDIAEVTVRAQREVGRCVQIRSTLT